MDEPGVVNVPSDNFAELSNGCPDARDLFLILYNSFLKHEVKEYYHKQMNMKDYEHLAIMFLFDVLFSMSLVLCFLF